MAIKDLRDIEREREQERKEKLKREVSNDMTDVVENVLNNLEDSIKRRKIEKTKRKSLFKKILGLVFDLAILLFVADLLLGSIWLLRFFIKSLFYT